jgi:hypothetical protein
MDKSLQSFYNDKETKDNVYNYLIEQLEKEALRMLFTGTPDDNAYQVAEAKKVIDKAWENMDNLFSPKAKKKEQVNQAK